MKKQVKSLPSLREARKFNGITLEQLSKELGPGYGSSWLSLVENNLRKPTPEQEKAIRDAIKRLVARRGQAA